MTTQNIININNSSYNTDNSCLFCCTSQGLLIYNINPFRQIMKKYIEGGLNFGCVLGRTNIFFLVGTGVNSKYPTNRVVIWDYHKNSRIAEISINSKIEGLLLNNMIIINSKNKIYAYDIDSLEKKYELDIVSPLFSIYFKDDYYLLCYPLISYSEIGTIVINEKKKYNQVKAHADQIQQIAISHDGNKIATCSIKGFLIKIFDKFGQLVNTFSRGMYSKTICYLGFSVNDEWLICATEFGTIHLFDIVNCDNIFPRLMRTRSSYNYKTNDIITDCYYNEKSNIIYFNSLSKIYSGYIDNNSLIINETYLLIIEKDPFSLSPKYLKNISN